MFTPGSLNDATLNKLFRVFSGGDFLFKQEDKGNTMFVIVQGTVLLYRKTMNVDRLVGTLVAGEMVGEKAILSETPYRRTLSAVAKTDVTAMELDAKNLKLISAKLPDFTLKVMGIVVRRLDEANELVGILQLKDPVERLIQFLLFHCSHHHKKVPQGVEIALSAESIQDAVNVDPAVVAMCFKDLVRKKIVIEKQGGYLITDENSLIAILPELKSQAKQAA